MSRVFIGLGSNEGDRLRAIFTAIRLINTLSETSVIQMAVIIETEPVGGPPQEPYLNTVAELQTQLNPQDLLAEFLRIETRLGRHRPTERWGPRPIDLDLLLYDDQVIHEPDLEVPHPRLHERHFVLEPLVQLAPDLIHPVLSQSISQLLEELLQRSFVH